MFSTEEKSKTSIEKDVILGDMERKYPEKIMIAVNYYVGEERIKGDIISILSPDEHYALKLPKPLPLNCCICVGITVQNRRLGLLC